MNKKRNLFLRKMFFYKKQKKNAYSDSTSTEIKDEKHLSFIFFFLFVKQKTQFQPFYFIIE